MLALDQQACGARQDHPLPVCPWEGNPYGLVSVWDMLAWSAKDFLRAHTALSDIQHEISGLISRHVISSAEAPNDDNRLKILTHVMAAQSACLQLELDVSWRKLGRMEASLRDYVNCHYSYGQILEDVRAVTELIQDQLSTRAFAFIPQAKEKYFMASIPFSKEVCDAFPSAQRDAREAETCYALGRNTASVFHSMRVAERGLRRLASELSVPIDPDSSTWYEIINKIEKEIRRMQDTIPKGAGKAETLKFYSEVASQSWHFKEAWRNHVSHLRGVYDEAEAFKVLINVRDFMGSLVAGGLHEVVSVP